MRLNTQIFPYSDETLGWLSKRVQSRYMLSSAHKLLNSAFPNQGIYFSSVFGSFSETHHSTLHILAGSIILIAPQEGFALLKSGSGVYLLEKGTTAILSGPLNVQIALSADPFEFYTCQLGNGILSGLVQALFVNLSPGEFRLLRNRDIGCPPENPIITPGSLPNQSVADSTLLLLLAMRAPGMTSRESFAPKRLGKTNNYNDLANSIWKNPDSNWSLSDAANEVGVSTFYLSRTFRSEALVGLREYILDCKIRNCSFLLLEKDISLDEVRSLSGIHPKQSLSRLIRNSIGFSQKFLISFRESSPNR
jgi:AraC-like DNA-binding protein